MLVSKVIKGIPNHLDDTPQIAYLLSKVEDFLREGKDFLRKGGEELPIFNVLKSMTKYNGFEDKKPLDCRNEAIDYIMDVLTYNRICSEIIGDVEVITYKHIMYDYMEPFKIYRKFETKLEGEVSFCDFDIQYSDFCKKLYEDKYFNEEFEIADDLETWLIR